MNIWWKLVKFLFADAMFNLLFYFARGLLFYMCFGFFIIITTQQAIGSSSSTASFRKIMFIIIYFKAITIIIC